MSADLLRQAAAKMRERAEELSIPAPGPWEAHPATNGDPADGPTIMRVSDAARDEIADLPYVKFGGLAAEHIASWHPYVALAVADWLEESADHLEVAEDDDLDPGLLPHVCPTAREGLECSVLGQALAVANAYLGTH